MPTRNSFKPILIIAAMLLLLGLVVLENLGVLGSYGLDLGFLWGALFVLTVVGLGFVLGFDPYEIREKDDRIRGLTVESEVQHELLRLQRAANAESTGATGDAEVS